METTVFSIHHNQFEDDKGNNSNEDNDEEEEEAHFVLRYMHVSDICYCRTVIISSPEYQTTHPRRKNKKP